MKRERELYLLIPNGESTLCLLIVLRELLQVLHRLGLQHRSQEFDVLLRVFMPRLLGRHSSCYIATNVWKKLT